MSKESRINYSPSLSVRENALRNNVSEAGIRYYIRTRGIDRRYERKAGIIESIRKYIKGSPDATMYETVRATGHDMRTIRKYWDAATGTEDCGVFRAAGKISGKGLREMNDYYATHPSCAADILREETFGHLVLEPFCGIGSISEVVRAHGHCVESYDIVDRGYGKVGDFFRTDFPPGKYDIISNPPYSGDLTAIVSRCIELCKDKVALIMPLRYLSGKERYRNIYETHPPARIYVYVERIGIAKHGDFKKYSDAGANKEIYAWFIWQKGHTGATELRWIHNSKNW